MGPDQTSAEPRVWRQALPVDPALGEDPKASEFRPARFTRLVPVAVRDGDLPPIETTSAAETPLSPAARVTQRVTRAVIGPPLDVSAIAVERMRKLVTSFPADAVAANAELTAVAAAAELMRGSLAEGVRYLAVAAAGEASMPAGRREHFRVTLAVLRLYLTRQRGDLRLSPRRWSSCSRPAPWTWRSPGSARNCVCSR